MQWTQIFLNTFVCAFVGYITNAIALWLLFRPQKPYLGGKIQGIIPSRQAEIAAKIGEKVANDILTPDSVSIRLADEVLHRDTATIISDELNRRLNDDLPSFNDLIGPENAKLFRERILRIFESSKSSFSKWLESEDSKKSIEPIIGSLLGMSLSSLLPDLRCDLHEKLS
ncbi:MAG: DUF445 family protein, partial [Candidatus Riflebacteria bacterium]|nr:DUF445 family protein [Candidatus Riflebacteria bacterium]